jgi:hypothetical protein
MRISEARLLTYGIALGAGLMFVLDPRQGGARRALVRDKSLRALHDVEDAAAVGSRDLAHRLEGVVARVRRPRRREDVTDDVLVSRVRSKLGHVCSHPHAIQVNPKGNGMIELKGPILSKEAARVVSAISRVRGVRTIDDDLERHDHPDVPALQGGPVARPAATRFWSPALRLALGAGAATVGVASLIGGNPLGLVIGGASVLALARSSTRGTHPRMLRQALPESTVERGRDVTEAPSTRYPAVQRGENGPTPAT